MDFYRKVMLLTDGPGGLMAEFLITLFHFAAIALREKELSASAYRKASKTGASRETVLAVQVAFRFMMCFLAETFLSGVFSNGLIDFATALVQSQLKRGLRPHETAVVSFGLALLTNVLFQFERVVTKALVSGAIGFSLSLATRLVTYWLMSGSRQRSE